MASFLDFGTIGSENSAVPNQSFSRWRTRMGLNGIGDLGGHFRMPEWIHELTGSGGAAHLPDVLRGGETSVAAPPPPPTATAAALRARE
jgi:hypothetical protein